MKRYKRIAFLTVFIMLLCIGSANAKNYAVLISAGRTFVDDAVTHSEYWYDMYLMYTTLIDEGYSHDDIYVLYGNGSDFVSAYECYQSPYPVTDFPNYESNIESIFNYLGSIMTEDDFLFVWWMGHGSREWVSGGWHLLLFIENAGVWILDVDLANYINQVKNYRIRTFSFMTCFSGGIIDDLEGPNSIVLTAAAFCPECGAASDTLCDNWHAEFNYYEACAFHWETPCNLCGSVDADYNENSRVSFEEAYVYTDYNMLWSDPQKSDQSNMAPDTYLGSNILYCCPDGSGDFLTIQEAIDTALDGYTIVLCDTTFSDPGNRDIDYHGKTITVRSESGNPDICIIDCENVGRGFYFHSGENLSSVLEAITIINGNASVSGGGGILCDSSSSPTIANCKMIENSSTVGTGGIHCQNYSSPTISSCTFSGNMGHLAGGISCRDYSSPTIEWCAITGNRGYYDAGGISCGDSCFPAILHSTISGNRGIHNAGGIMCYDSAYAENTIIWGNCAGSAGDEVYLPDNSSVITFACCDVDSSGIQGSGTVIWLHDNIYKDPQFCKRENCQNAPTTAGDYTIAESSPCAEENSPECGLIGALGVACQLRGDCLSDGVIDIGDLLYLINYLYKGGLAPDPLFIGDVNCDGLIDLEDVGYLINYLYKGGPPPCGY